MSRKEFLILKVVAAFILRSQKAVMIIIMSVHAHHLENSQESICSILCPKPTSAQCQATLPRLFYKYN